MLSGLAVRVEYSFEITSNHNWNAYVILWGTVEYSFEITSNHNRPLLRVKMAQLNILLKLHQTTTPFWWF